MNMNDLLKDRRSIYHLGKDIPVSDEEVIQLVTGATQLVPDAFNMKSQRVVIALGEKQKQLWDRIYQAFEGKVPREKIDSFQAAHGTLLYFYDRSIVEHLQQQFPLYAANFPVWAQQSNGMLQICIWTGLRALGIGANIQHYNPVIDDTVRELFALPEEHVLVAQMPFGAILDEPGAKEAEDPFARVKVVR